MTPSPTLRYILIGAIVLVVAGFLGWYVFIRAKQSEIEAADAARGIGVAAPSFASRVGSTYENILSTLSDTFSGDRESTALTDETEISQVNKTPTAGAGFIGNGTSTRLRFVERGTGYMFDFFLETGALERLTNTLVPRTHEAEIAPNGHTIMRSEEEDGDIVTAKARISTTTTPGETLYPLLREFLPGAITASAISPEGSELFYVISTESGGRGIRAPWSGAPEKEVISSAISGWHAHWLPSDRIVLVQRPSDDVSGYAYEVSSGRFLPLAYAPGLTFLPHPALQALLFGTSAGEGVSLYSRAGATSTDTVLPIKTIADKCVWHPRTLTAYCAVPQTAPSNDFLERYYRGEAHTQDAWWKVDARSGTVELLLPPGNATIDVERPIIDDTGTEIAFINAIDKSLWRLKLR